MNKPLINNKLPPVNNILFNNKKDSHLRKQFESKEKLKEFPLLSKTAAIESRPAPKKVAVSTAAKSVYKYKHIPGNNGRVILANFRKRPWWHSGNKKQTTQGNSEDDSKEKLTNAKEVKEIVNFDMVWEMSRNPKRYKFNDYNTVVLNHLENNCWLVSKKYLYFCIRDYYAKIGKDHHDIIPRTFYLAPSEDDVKGEYKEFCEFNKQYKSSLSPSPAAATALESGKEEDSTGKSLNHGQIEGEGPIWIVKPASYANRGFGIKVVKGQDAVIEVTQRCNSADSTKSTKSNGTSASRYIFIHSLYTLPRNKIIYKNNNYFFLIINSNDSELPRGTDPFNMNKRAKKIAKSNGWICQEYIYNPLLVSGRKFDIRCFVLLVNSTKEGFKAYWFQDGYIRTSCKKYSLNKLSDRETHLTNDAVQKHSKMYGKFESGNKLTYPEWQEVINKDYPGTSSDIVASKIIPTIKEQARVSILAALEKGLSKTKIHRSFELLGYDFMITSDFKPLLIEINTNPCLEFACPLLENLIGSLISNVWKVAVDGFFKPPDEASRTKSTQEAIERIASEPDLFELLYDSKSS